MGKMRKIIRGLVALVILTMSLSNVGIEPVIAGPISQPENLHVATNISKSKSFLSWSAPAGLNLSPTALANIQIQEQNGAWISKAKVPWWQSLVDVSNWPLEGSIARVFYSVGLQTGRPSETVSLSSARSLLESGQYSQKQNFQTTFSAAKRKLSVSWFRPNFETNWYEYAQSPVFLELVITYGSIKKTYKLPITASNLNLSVSSNDLKKTYKVSGKFFYQNGQIESVLKSGTLSLPVVTPTPTPKPFVLHHIGIESTYDSCIFEAYGYSASGAKRSLGAQATFNVEPNGGSPYQTKGSVDLMDKPGDYRIKATASFGSVTKSALIGVTSSPSSGTCEMYAATPDVQTPQKLNMPIKLAWPAIIVSTGTGYKLNIETRVPMSGFSCSISIGKTSRSLALDSYGMGSLYFNGIDMFFLPGGQLGTISGTCENSKYLGNLPILIMKSTDFTSTWQLVQG